MLATKVLIEIRRLLDEGRLTQRQIAHRMGVSRSSVQAIVRGKRDLRGRDNNQLRFPHFSLNPDDLPKRCPTCGGMVFMPCVLCEVRRKAVRC